MGFSCDNGTSHAHHPLPIIRIIWSSGELVFRLLDREACFPPSVTVFVPGLDYRRRGVATKQTKGGSWVGGFLGGQIGQ